MGVDICNPSPCPDRAQEVEEAVTIDRPAESGCEKGLCRFGIWPGGEIAPDGLASAGREGYRTFPGTFAHDLDAPVAVVDLVDFDVT